jgi:hypothetical protein
VVADQDVESKKNATDPDEDQALDEEGHIGIGHP